MFNRKLHTLVAVVSLALLPVVASASTSRLEGMTLPGDYTSDYTNIYMWPSSITGVGNLVYGELGNTLNPNGSTLKSAQDDLGMGAILPNLCAGKYGVWAIHLRSWTPAWGQGDNQTGANPGWFGADPNSNANQSFDIGWGYKAGNKSLGLTLTRSFNSLVDEIPGTTWTFEQDSAIAYGYNEEHLRRNLFGIGVGLGMEHSQNLTSEIALQYQSRTFEDSRTGTGFSPYNYSDDGGMNLLVGGRAMWKAQPNLTIIPVAKYYKYDLSDKYKYRLTATHDTTESTENSVTGYQIGLAGNWTLGSNDLFVLGATLASNKVDQEWDLFGIADYNSVNDTLTVTETLAPQVFMALETQVNSWLALRMGATKAVFHTTKLEAYNGSGLTRTKQTITLKDSPFEMNAGATVKLGSLKFDTVLASGFFNNPFGDLLGGSNSTTSSPFAKVSATYTW